MQAWEALLRWKESQPSFRGWVLREGVRMAFRLDEHLMEHMDVFQSKEPSAPRGFIDQRKRLSESWLELLRPSGYYKRREEALARGQQPAAPRTILHLHGGGYLIGLLDPYRYISLNYLRRTEADLVATLDYRHAPEHVFPAALDDAVDAWHYLLAQGCQPEQVVVVGDSAGANLALGLMLRLRDEGDPLPGGAVLMSPWADMTFSGASIYTKRFEDPMFGVRAGEELRPENYLRFTRYLGDHDPTDPYISPVFGDYTDLPPMLVQTGSEEMLMSDSLRIVENCERAGVPVLHRIYRGMFHTFQVIGGSPLPEGREAWDEASQAIRGMWGANRRA